MEWSLVFVWLVVPLALGALGLPLVSALCPRLPFRGATVALPASLATLTLVVYWAGHVSFGLPAVVLAVLVLGVASGVLYRRGVEVQVRGYGEAAAVFTLGFALVIFVRSSGPTILPGTENFLNFGLLQSLLRAPALPPEDMWFAGERVHYYYGGHLLAASLAELTGTAGRYAYNFAFAVVYGTLLATAYGVGGAIVADRDVPRRLAGGSAAFFVGLASNLFVPFQALLWALPADLAGEVAAWVDVPPRMLRGFEIYDPVHFAFTNTDFPMYSVLLGTLHAHVMSTPFLVLAIGLLVAYYRTPGPEVRRRRALLAATAATAGAIGLINAWSLPTALGLVAVTLALAPASPGSLLPTSPDLDAVGGSRFGPALARGGVAVGLAGVAGVVAVALGSPYFLGGTPGDLGVGFLPDRSPWHYFLLAHGAFLFAFALYALPRVHAALDPRSERTALAVGTVLVGVGLFAGFHGLAIVGPIALAGLYLALADDDAGYEAVLIVAGAGLVLLVELVYLREPAEPGRFNTAYKTYMQTWLVWGLAAGVALARIVEAVPNPTTDLLGGEWRAEVLVVLLVVSVGIYGVGFVGTNATDTGLPGERTMDGTAGFEPIVPDKMAGVYWLSARPGRPTIVSAPATEGYMYSINASFAASLTGIPTVVGWGHERDYRDPAAFRKRVEDVDTVYFGTPRDRAAVLATYDVEYVWVGPAERGLYRLLTIDPDAEPWLSVAFERGSVTIYAVNQSALPAG